MLINCFKLSAKIRKTFQFQGFFRQKMQKLFILKHFLLILKLQTLKIYNFVLKSAKLE